MGTATRTSRERFLQLHPSCIFCGGTEAATTVEHCPPRAMFQERKWPEGFEFPACAKCNHGSGDDDLLVSMIARMDPFKDLGSKDGRTPGMMKNVNRQYPGLLQKMLPTAIEARQTNRRLGVNATPGMTHQEMGAVKIPEEIHSAVCVFAAKLAKAVYYFNTVKVFPKSGCLLLNWFTNADLFQHGKYAPLETLKDISGEIPVIQRTGKYLGDQFEYKLSITDDNDIFIAQVIFGKSFGMAVFGSTISGKLEDIVKRLRKDTDKNGPFAVIQSVLIQTTTTSGANISTAA